ncbi:MAG: peptidylprolyl isomerase [Acidobacteria bacterium]|nr:peptidylprolyl isomerase [Acidobacteriota bacterium]
MLVGAGAIEILLLAQDAPIAAVNFADLAEAGYYDGTSFMRVVPNFVIQGGDPRNDMSGGPGYSIRDEINLQKYTRGAVGMALSGPDTGGSQFFITHSPQPHLDGGYTIFGRVTDGMTATVDQIRRGDTVTTIRIDSATHTDQESADKSARNPLPMQIGKITPERTLSAIPEYRERMESYEPDETVISMMAPLVSSEDRIEVFLGTWCEDSQREMPRFYKIMEQLEQQDVTIPIQYVAVDRSKQEPSDLIGDRAVQLVPTFIVYRGDTEIGRVVEKPQSLLEDDLLMIFASAGR